MREMSTCTLIRTGDAIDWIKTYESLINNSLPVYLFNYQSAFIYLYLLNSHTGIVKRGDLTRETITTF